MAGNSNLHDAMNFNALGLKSLTATCYATSPVVYTQLDLFGADGGLGVPALPKRGRGRARSPSAPRKVPYKIVITEVTDENGDGRVDLADVEWLIRNKKNVLSRLAGDGDFRSPECVALLKDAERGIAQPMMNGGKKYRRIFIRRRREGVV